MTRPIGAKEQQLRDMRSAEKTEKSHGRIAKLKATLSGQTKALPLAGKAALAKIDEEPKPAPAAPAPAKQEIKTVKKPAKKTAAAKKAAAKAMAKPSPKAKAAAAKPAKRKAAAPARGKATNGDDRSPLAVGKFMVAGGDQGVTMDSLVKRFGIEAHPMRSKIHAARHKLGFGVSFDAKAKVYRATAPKAG